MSNLIYDSLGFFAENIHNIQFEMESIIDRTLLLQRPNMMLDKRQDAEVQVDLELPSKNGGSELKTEVKEISGESSINDCQEDSKRMIEVLEKQRIPW